MANTRSVMAPQRQQSAAPPAGESPAAPDVESPAALSIESLPKDAGTTNHALMTTMQTILEELRLMRLSFETNLRQTVQDEVPAAFAAHPPAPVVPEPAIIPAQADDQAMDVSQIVDEMSQQLLEGARKLELAAYPPTPIVPAQTTQQMPGNQQTQPASKPQPRDIGFSNPAAEPGFTNAAALQQLVPGCLLGDAKTTCVEGLRYAKKHAWLDMDAQPYYERGKANRQQGNWQQEPAATVIISGNSGGGTGPQQDSDDDKAIARHCS